MGFDVAPVDLNVVILEAFGVFLFDELQMVVICEVAEGVVSLLWGVACGVGSYVVDMYGDRPLLEIVFVCELVGRDTFYFLLYATFIRRFILATA